MDVSIIFVNYKTKDLTINAIKSVIETTEGLDYEIFVVDNNSQDGSIEAIEKEFPNINIIKNPVNAGFGAANNIGIKKASGKYVFCLNTDTISIENAVKKMYDYMEKNENVGACGCQLLNSDGTFQNSFGYFHTYFDFLIRQGLFKCFYKKTKKIKKITDVDYVAGADIFIRKSVLSELGLFDEKIFMYEDEVDLCYRIRQKYAVRLLPDARIIHLGGESSTSNFTRENTIKGIFYFVKKHKTVSQLFLKIYYIVKYGVYSCFSKDKFYKDVVFSLIKKTNIEEK